MADTIKPSDEAASPEATAVECLVSWKSADGSINSIGPLSRDRAEMLVQVYRRMDPHQTQTWWVQPLLKEVEELHVGRVRRMRPHPVVRPSDREH